MTTNEFRPFRIMVESLRSQPLEKQYTYFLRLSEGLMTEDYAGFTRQVNLPHFGHLVAELHRQQMLPLLRTLIKRGNLNPYHHWVISERLSRECDAETFDILLSISEKSMSDSLKASGEDVDALSVVSLGHYLSSTNYREKAEAHLLKLLRRHGHPSVRAFAAEALRACDSLMVVQALEEATKDHGRVLTPQGPYDE